MTAETMNAETATRERVARSAGAVALFAVLFLVWTRAGIGGQRIATIFDDVTETFAALFAAAACFVTARRRADARRAWFVLGAAAASWGIGQVVWSVYEIGLDRATPFPSFADVGYLGFVPLGALAMLLFPASRRAPVAARGRAFMDGLVIATASLFISWTFLLREVYRMGEGGILAQSISLAYPAGDVLLVAALLFVAARSRLSDRLSFAFVGVGLVCFVVADTAFAYMTTAGTYGDQNGWYTDVGWPAGFLLIACGAVFALREKSAIPSQERTAPGLFGLSLPYVPVVIAMTVGLAIAAGARPLDDFLVWTGALMLMFILVRQFLALYENTNLSRFLVAERAELALRADELQKAYEKLSEEQTVRDHFLAVASHELGTPLSAVLGLSKTLLHRWAVTSDEDKRDFTERMARQVSRLTRVADGLLTVARLEQGAIEVHTQLVALSPLLYEVVGESFEDTSQVNIECPAELVVRADRDFVAQIVVNFLSNAKKYGAQPITVTAVRDGDRVVVRVHDAGRGVPSDLEHRLFEKFSRADTGAALRGSGLGLWIVKTLAEAMQGSAWYEGGATFAVALPVAAAQSESVTA